MGKGRGTASALSGGGGGGKVLSLRDLLRCPARSTVCSTALHKIVSTHCGAVLDLRGGAMMESREIGTVGKGGAAS